MHILLVPLWFPYLKNKQDGSLHSYTELGKRRYTSRKDANTVHSSVPQLHFPDCSYTSPAMCPEQTNTSMQVNLAPSISLPWHIPTSWQCHHSFSWPIILSEDGRIKAPHSLEASFYGMFAMAHLREWMVCQGGEVRRGFEISS